MILNFSVDHIQIDKNTEYYYFDYVTSDIQNFINENKNTKFDASKEYCVISGGYYNLDSYVSISFFTNDVEAVRELIEKDKELHDYYDDYEYDEEDDVFETIMIDEDI